MLVSCEECGREISDQAEACPGCGKKKLTCGAKS
jgi:RNA polymerase subunit RPABC4/transcription elongation factor Spt4